MMKVVIEIDETLYSRIVKDVKPIIYDSTAFSQNMIESIRNGTPLPKNHGDLLDRDALLEYVSSMTRPAFSHHDVWLLLSKYNKGVPVLIGEDKEQNNE